MSDIVDKLIADLLGSEPRRSWHERLRTNLRRKWRCRRHWNKEIKYFIQRGRRGYSTRDTWGFDYHLAKVIVGGITELRERNLGHPCMCPSLCSKPCDCAAQWQKILADIIEGYQLYADDELFLWPRDEVKEAENNLKYETAQQLLMLHWRHLWD